MPYRRPGVALPRGWMVYVSKPIRGEQLAEEIRRLNQRGNCRFIPPEVIRRPESGCLAGSARRRSGCRRPQTRVAKLPPQLQQIKQALAQQVTEQLQMVAHTLKGSMGVFPIDSANLITRIEQLARQQPGGTGTL